MWKILLILIILMSLTLVLISEYDGINNYNLIYRLKDHVAARHLCSMLENVAYLFTKANRRSHRQQTQNTSPAYVQFGAK